MIICVQPPVSRFQFFSFQVPFDTIIKNATSKIADTGVMLGATIPTGCGTAWILGMWRPRRKLASVAQFLQRTVHVKSIGQ